MQIRYKGHTTQTVIIGSPKRACEKWKTAPDIVALINNAAETHISDDIAELLNEKGFVSGKGKPFTPCSIRRIMYIYLIPSIRERYLERGYVTCAAKAASMGLTSSGLMYQIKAGKYIGECVRVSSRNEYLFPPPDQNCEVDHA